MTELERTLISRVEELESAIGVSVPTIIRCFIKISDSALDREFAAKTLARVNNAMRDATVIDART